MTDTTLAIPLTLTSRAEQIFPILTPAQVARIAQHGHARPVMAGEVLLEAGEQNLRFFVVTAGQIEVVALSGGTESLVARLRSGQFTGEVNMLLGRRGFVRIRASTSGEVIELDREHLLALVQTDSELSEQIGCVRRTVLMKVDGARGAPYIDRYQASGHPVDRDQSFPLCHS